MRMHGVAIGFISVFALAGCGRTSLDFVEQGEGASVDREADYSGVAVRHIAWEDERPIAAPDDGVWLVFGSPPPSCGDPVVSGGGEGWHIATYIPPAELGDGEWDFADGTSQTTSETTEAHQGWFFAWQGAAFHDERLHDGSLRIDALDDAEIFGSVHGVLTAMDDESLPDPERVDADVEFSWCP